MGPLAGVRVLDLSQVIAGPVATQILADQGADVIKVETTELGDLLRLNAFEKGGIAAIYANLNRGKRAISVDVTTDAGRHIVLDLAAAADVVVQNFRPGAVERLGLGYQDVVARRPDVIYCSISGYGPDGPYADRPVLDPVIQCLIGMSALQRNPQIPIPDLVRSMPIDKASALLASQAITAALFARERGAGGQHIELAMLDAGISYFWPDGMMDQTLLDDDVSGGFLITDVYNLTDTATDKIVYFVATDEQRCGLYRALGHPEWAEDDRFNTRDVMVHEEHRLLLGQMLADAFLEVTADEIIPRLVAADVPCAPVRQPAELPEDPQVAHNGTLVTWEHSTAGRLRQPRAAARFSETQEPMRQVVARLGEHTRQVLSEMGRSDDEIDALVTAGVVRVADEIA